MNKRPLVSIIIPVYNGVNYLKKAIDSALTQTYKNIEVLVIDDGSTDKTEELALSYGDKIRYFKKENGGVSSALNLGLREMKGEYFSWLSHDDEYANTKIEKQLELIEKYKEENLICLCDFIAIDKDSKPLRQKSKKRSLIAEKIIPANEILTEMLKNGTYNFCAFLAPKKVFDDCGFFEESLRFLQDFYMCCKIFLAKYNVVYLKEPLVFNRIHNNQVTQTRRDLYYQDSEWCSDYLIPSFLRISTKKDNMLYKYALSSARKRGGNIVSKCISLGKENKIFSVRNVIRIKLVTLYGKIRPFIRKIYYRLIYRVKTK